MQAAGPLVQGDLLAIVSRFALVGHLFAGVGPRWVRGASSNLVTTTCRTHRAVRTG
jgi:hypothetical protein